MTREDTMEYWIEDIWIYQEEQLDMNRLHLEQNFY